MLYLVLLCCLVSLATAVIVEDKEPVPEETNDGALNGVVTGDVAGDVVNDAANDAISLTDSEQADLAALAA